MILIATNERDITSDYIVVELKKRNIPFVRINTERLPTAKIHFNPKLGKNSWLLEIDEQYVSFSEVRAGYYRRPGSPLVDDGIASHSSRVYCETEWGSVLFSALNSIGDKWLNSPTAINLAENKPLQLSIAFSLGFSIPETSITNSLGHVETSLFDKNIVVKPLRQALLGSGKEERVIFTNRVEHLSDIDKISLSLAPIIIQQEIRKESDIRVTVIGKKIFAVELRSQEYKETQTDWRKGSRVDIAHLKHNLPEYLCEQCINLVSTMGLKFGAIDLVLDSDGGYWFLEINPNGQWAWLENRTNIPLTSAIVDELENIAA